MPRLQTLCLSAACLLACSLPAMAQEKGRWHPVSSTARSITGEVAFSDTKLLLNLVSFPIATVRPLTPAELTAAFVLDNPATGAGHLYRVDIPASKVLLNKNTLCGASDTHWLVTYVEGHRLQVAFFSSDAVPTFTPEAISNSTDLCGIFNYDK